MGWGEEGVEVRRGRGGKGLCLRGNLWIDMQPEGCLVYYFLSRCYLQKIISIRLKEDFTTR